MVCKARCPSWPPKMNSSPALPLSFFFNVNDCLYLFIYLWLCWVFVSVRGLSLVAASGGHSSSRCAGLSLSRPLLLQSTGSWRAGSVIMAHGPSCSAACGIFPDQGSNPCPLHWQTDSQPLRHQGSPCPAPFWSSFPALSSATPACSSSSNQAGFPLKHLLPSEIILLVLQDLFTYLPFYKNKGSKGPRIAPGNTKYSINNG